MDVRLDSIHLYPLKSGASIDVKTALVEHDGLRGDRRIMIVAEDGTFITSRQSPELLKVHCSFDGDAVVFSAAGKNDVLFPRCLEQPSYRAVRIWKDGIRALDAGDRAAEWMSDFIGQSCRVVFQGFQTVRNIRDHPGLVAFADTAPILLIGQSSLEELNQNLDVPVEMARFRPNLVVTGEEPFGEDQWGFVRIGGVDFEAIGACSRCKVTTLDPTSSVTRTDNEPLATLSKRRRGIDGEAYFGQFIRPLTNGRLHLGEPVTILTRKSGPHLHPAPASTRLVSSYSTPPKGSGPFDMTCVGITYETTDMATFRFKVDGGPWANYQPGQFLTLALDIDGEMVKRSYTISSSPTRPHNISITTKRVEGGRLSNWLHQNLKVGSKVRANAPGGQFHLGRVGDSKKLLMLSAGSGVTPMISMLRAISDLDLPYDVVFHHSCRTASDMPFREELQALMRTISPRLVVTWNLSRSHAADEIFHDVLHGRLDEAMLTSVCPDIVQRITLCCGPDEFRKAARSLHLGLAPSAPFLEESFGASVEPGREDKPTPFDVKFTKSGKSIKGVGVQTLLELAKQAGVHIPSDCEAGICGSCRCRVASGSWTLSARCADTDRLVLSDAEKAADYILACTTRPVGQIQLEI